MNLKWIYPECITEREKNKKYEQDFKISMLECKDTKYT